MAMFLKRHAYATLLIAAILLVVGFWALKPRGDAVVYQGKPIRAWAIAASSGDPEANAVLKNLGTNAVPGLVDLLERKDSFLRRQVGAIASKMPRRLGGRLVNWGTKRDTVICRSAAAKALGLLGPEAELAVPNLIKALRDSEPQVSLEAAGTLGRIGKPAVPELMRALADSNGFVRNCAAYALGQIGAAAEPAVPALLEALGDTNRDVRASAAYSAAVIGFPSMLALSNVLDHGDANARAAAVQQLIRSQRSFRMAVPGLVKMAQAEEAATRQTAIGALGALRLADGAAFHTLTNALEDPVPEVRLAAVKSLKLMIWRAHEALPQLIRRLHDDSAEVRYWAVVVIGDIGPRAAAAIPELKRTAESDPASRPSAEQAIRQIEMNR